MEMGIEVSGLWFNPNIHPYTEYKNRLDSVKELERIWKLDVEYIDHYGLKEYIRNVAGREEKRCEYCYLVRLEEAAKKATARGYDAFTTSLLVSPYQKFDIIVDIGRAMQDKYSVEFFAEDFRTGFRQGRMTAKEMNLYRQKYCGCIYSEMDRYLNSK
jgi:predicted adenine nucleotide alpha hydrolase (AANH) superfamily ATPase